jgi:hypothetical protein
MTSARNEGNEIVVVEKYKKQHTRKTEKFGSYERIIQL